MYIDLILFIVLQLIAFLFFAETIRRVIRRAREFPLKEDASTLPFSFVRLRHVVIFYIVSYLLWVLFSLWVYFSLIHSSIPVPSSALSPAGTIQY